jgi:hypothetical protein
MELNVKLCPTDGDPLPDPTRYRHLVGSLVYLVVTCPDISYLVHILSQFVSAPTTVHYSHLLRVLRYLHGTITRCLFFPRSSSLQLQCYSDATWTSDPTDRRSFSAYYVFLGGSLVAWKMKKQVTVSRSSVEAELRAMALLIAEVTWLRWLLADFGVSITTPTPLLFDSTGAISIARDPVKMSLPSILVLMLFIHVLRCRLRLLRFSMCLQICSWQISLQRHKLKRSMTSYSPNLVLWIHHEFEGGC